MLNKRNLTSEEPTSFWMLEKCFKINLYEAMRISAQGSVKISWNPLTKLKYVSLHKFLEYTCANFPFSH